MLEQRRRQRSRPPLRSFSLRCVFVCARLNLALRIIFALLLFLRFHLFLPGRFRGWNNVNNNNIFLYKKQAMTEDRPLKSFLRSRYPSTRGLLMMIIGFDCGNVIVLKFRISRRLISLSISNLIDVFLINSVYTIFIKC